MHTIPFGVHNPIECMNSHRMQTSAAPPLTEIDDTFVRGCKRRHNARYAVVLGVGPADAHTTAEENQVLLPLERVKVHPGCLPHMSITRVYSTHRWCVGSMHGVVSDTCMAFAVSQLNSDT